MHTFDIIILVLCALFVLIGIKRGFVIEIFRFAAMIAGFIIAFLYYPDIRQMIPLGKLPGQVQNSISFLLTYIVTAAAIITMGWIIKKIIHFSLLGWLDRLLGAVIGIFKSLMITWVACLSIAALPSDRVRENFSKSITFQFYKSLPSGMELEGVHKVRSALRTISNSKAAKKIKPEAEK